MYKKPNEWSQEMFVSFLQRVIIVNSKLYYDTETVKLASNRLMIDRIRQVDGVTDVSEAKTNVIGRKLYLSYRVDTIYGQIEGGVEVG